MRDKSYESFGRLRNPYLVVAGVGALATALLVPKMPANALTRSNTCNTNNAEIRDPGFERYLKSPNRQKKHETLLKQKASAIQAAVNSGIITSVRKETLPDGSTLNEYTGSNGVKITLTGQQDKKGKRGIIDGLSVERIQPNSPALLGVIRATIQRGPTGVFAGSYQEVENADPTTLVASTVLLMPTATGHDLIKACQITSTEAVGEASQYTRGPLALNRGSAIDFDGKAWGNVNGLFAFAGIPNVAA